MWCNCVGFVRWLAPLLYLMRWQFFVFVSMFYVLTECCFAITDNGRLTNLKDKSKTSETMNRMREPTHMFSHHLPTHTHRSRFIIQNHSKQKGISCTTYHMYHVNIKIVNIPSRAMVLNRISNIPPETFTELSQTKRRPTDNKLVDS